MPLNIFLPVFLWSMQTADPVAQVASEKINCSQQYQQPSQSKYYHYFRYLINTPWFSLHSLQVHAFVRICYRNLTTNTDKILKKKRKILDSSIAHYYMELTVKYGNYTQNTEKWCVLY